MNTIGGFLFLLGTVFGGQVLGQGGAQATRAVGLEERALAGRGRLRARGGGGPMSDSSGIPRRKCSLRIIWSVSERRPANTSEIRPVERRNTARGGVL